MKHHPEHNVTEVETEEERREARTKMAKGAMEAGLSEEDAYLVIDLVQHAKMKAYDVFQEIAETAPQHLQGMVMYEALLHFKNVIDATEMEIKSGALMATLKAVMFSKLHQAAKERETQKG